jgi:hypothetical protein
MAGENKKFWTLNAGFTTLAGIGICIIGLFVSLCVFLYNQGVTVNSNQASLGVKMDYVIKHIDLQDRQYDDISKYIHVLTDNTNNNTRDIIENTKSINVNTKDIKLIVLDIQRQLHITLEDLMLGYRVNVHNKNMISNTPNLTTNN